ncbi:MAG: DUF3048 domain-containing protein [Lachnospiraceae bacterium]|jgi:hypothetical protein|nr:DUF3048 domain-containing protein [Lachnospiraceae bacterium]
MKKFQKIIMTCLFPLLLFSGCTSKDAPKTALEPIDNPQSVTQTSLPEKAGEDMFSPEPATDLPPMEGMVRSRITNEWIDEKTAKRRPISFMVPNTKTASQYGISKADILYECNVESNITRLMGICESWDDTDKIGNIRSSRDYFMYWSFEWDAFHIHYGGPFYMDDLLDRNDSDNINLNIDISKTYHFRDVAKNDFDNAFTSSSLIRKYINNAGYSLNYRDNYSDEQHFLFSSDQNPNMLTQYTDSIRAYEVDMSLAYPLTNCYFKYNKDTGLYDRYQHLPGTPDGPHVDLAANTPLTFKNLLVQSTYFEVRDQKGYLSFQCHDTTRDGWFFTNGRGIHVTWEKTSDYGATRYYDDNGNEIKLNTGKTMICILPNDDAFMVDGKTITM